MDRTPITDEELGGLFGSFRRTAFRLETRDDYALDYEAQDFEWFLAGDPVPPPEVGWWRPWLDQITELTRQGKQVARVRVVAEPPSPYQRWEIWAAPWHARAGERIGYMPRSKALRVGLPLRTDWWLLDDERLILMQFDAAGRKAGNLLVTDPEVVGQHCEWRDLAVRHAIPAEEVTAA
jgi:hypothetical protein